MRRKRIITALQADVERNRRDLWDLSGENADLRSENRRLVAELRRADETIMALWELREREKETGSKP